MISTRMSLRSSVDPQEKIELAVSKKVKDFIFD